MMTIIILWAVNVFVVALVLMSVELLVAMYLSV